MITTLFIRRHELTEEFDSRYLGTYANLLELDLDNNTITKLFEFFESATNLRTLLRAMFTNEEIHPPIFFKADSVLYGYTVMAYQTPALYHDRVKNLPEFIGMHSKMTELYNLLGWTCSDFKVVEIEAGGLTDIGSYENYPATFEEVDNLWNQAVPL